VRKAAANIEASKEDELDESSAQSNRGLIVLHLSETRRWRYDSEVLGADEGARMVFRNRQRDPWRPSTSLYELI
jgi:hypothetical protein